MSKKVFKVLLVFFGIFFMMSRVNADSLKQLKEKLAKDERNKAALIAEQKRVEAKVKAANKDVADINKKIDENNDKIDESKQKIKDLKKDIEEKQK